MKDLITISEPRQTSKRVRKREPGSRPPWLTVKYVRTSTFETVNETKDDLGLVTVCEEARCPNRHECWSAGTATFMLMGDICTRRCGFCAVAKGKPRALDAEEPRKIGEAIKLGVRHAVITSVNRDELPDGSAQHFAETVSSIKSIRRMHGLNFWSQTFSVTKLRWTSYSPLDRMWSHNVETMQALSTCSAPSDFPTKFGRTRSNIEMPGL